MRIVLFVCLFALLLIAQPASGRLHAQDPNNNQAESQVESVAIVPTDSELVSESRAIVRGKVGRIEAQLDPATGMVNTFVALNVSQVFKGQLDGNVIVLRQPGGEVRGQGTRVWGMPAWSVGEDVLVYLDTWPDGALRTRHYFLGKFEISGNRIRRSAGDHVRLIERAVDPHEITHQASLNLYLSVLKTKVLALPDRSTKGRLRATPPNYQPSLAEPFTFLSPSTPVRWFEPDSGQPVVYKVNPQRAPNASAVEDVVASLGAWSAVPGSALRLVYGGQSFAPAGAADGENVVEFNNASGYFSEGGCSGLLAVGGIVQYVSQSKVVNGITFYRVIESFVSFNPSAACYLANACNLQEVSTHEIGHSIGFGHSLDATATMYAYAHFDNRCASLKADDQEGARFVYPGSGAPTPTPNPTPTPTPNPTPNPTPSPAPNPTGGYTDIETNNPYRNHIEILRRRGIAIGCAPNMYCPARLATRAEAVAFIVRAVIGDPPAPTGQHFIDVPPSHPFFAYVEEAARRGITIGCAQSYFCPEAGITRAEMAAFIVRPLYGGAANVPYPSYQRFEDVPPSHPLYREVDALARLSSLLAECDASNLIFCPERKLRRDELAYWIVQAYGLR